MTTPNNLSGRAPRGRSLSFMLPSNTLNAAALPFTPELPVTYAAAAAHAFPSIEAEVADAAGHSIIADAGSSEASAVGSLPSAPVEPSAAVSAELTNPSASGSMETNVATAASTGPITTPPVELDAVSTELPAFATASFTEDNDTITVNAPPIVPPTVAPVPPAVATHAFATPSFAIDPRTGSETDEGHDLDTDDGHDGSIASGSHSSSATLAPESEADAASDIAGTADAIVSQYIHIVDMDGDTLTYEPSTPQSFTATTPSAQSMDLNSPTQSSSTTAHADPVFSYHRDADLFVKVNDSNGPANFKVCSALIAAASPVWRKQIYGGDHPHQDDGKWIIHMTGNKDRAFGLHVIFSIIHYQFSEVPETPTVDQYYDLTTVALHYDCCQLLIPFTRKWVNSYELRSKYDSQPDGKLDEKLLRIYWALGAGFLFLRALDRVVNTSTISPNGAFVNHEGRIWDDRDLPSHVIDDMINIRMSKVQRLLNAVREPAETLIINPDAGSRFCKSKTKDPDAKNLCHNMQLGSLMTGLNTAGLLPVPRDEEYRGSVYDLEVKLTGVKVIGYKTPGALPHQDLHGGCGIGHLPLIKEIMDHPGKPSEHTISELKMRGMKCGTFSRDLFTGVVHGYDHVEATLDHLGSNQTYYRQREEDLVEEYPDGSAAYGMVVPEITIEVADTPAPNME